MKKQGFCFEYCERCLREVVTKSDECNAGFPPTIRNVTALIQTKLAAHMTSSLLISGLPSKSYNSGAKLGVGRG